MLSFVIYGIMSRGYKYKFNVYEVKRKEGMDNMCEMEESRYYIGRY